MAMNQITKEYHGGAVSCKYCFQAGEFKVLADLFDHLDQSGMREIRF